jgi:multidrug efflux system membrane fusion protein
MRRTAPLAALLAGLVALGCNANKAAQPKDAGPPKVTAAAPLVQPVTEFTDLTGTLAAVKTADVRARVSGYILKVPFKEGAEVKEGDTLVQIDPEPFEVALGLARTEVKSAEAQREQASANEARLAKGFKAGVTSPEEYEQAKANKLVAIAAVEKAKKDVEQAKLNLDYATVKAPFDGRVDRIYVNEGNVVTGGTGQGTVLTRVVTMDPMYAYFTVNEQTVLEYIRRTVAAHRVPSQHGGVPVEIRLRDEQGYPHKGTIDFASSELSPTTGTLQIRGTFENPGPPWLLRPGLFVRGRIPGATIPQAVLIPDEAVVTDQAQRVVYVVGPGNRVVAKPVALGPRSVGLRVVEGLAPTDRVIINGLARVQPEMEVEPVPGQIKATQEADARLPGYPQPQGQPQRRGGVNTAPNGNPGKGAQPGAGGNSQEGGAPRGRPPMSATPQK